MQDVRAKQTELCMPELPRSKWSERAEKFNILYTLYIKRIYAYLCTGKNVLFLFTQHLLPEIFRKLFKAFLYVNNVYTNELHYAVLSFTSHIYSIFAFVHLFCIFIHIFINFSFQFIHFMANGKLMVNCMDCSVAALPALVRVLSLFVVQILLLTL